MKRIIHASDDEDYAIAMRKADNILFNMRELFDALEDTPAGFLDANGLGQFYLDLSDTLRYFDYTVSDGNIAYRKDKYGLITS